MLKAAAGVGQWPPLVPLAVDLEELAELLEGNPARGGGRLDVTTGYCLPSVIDAYGDAQDEDDAERRLVVWCAGSRDGYRDMRDFAADVSDEWLAARLERALSGRGAFQVQGRAGRCGRRPVAAVPRVLHTPPYGGARPSFVVYAPGVTCADSDPAARR